MTLRRLAGRALRQFGWRRSPLERVPRVHPRERLRDTPTKVTQRDDRTLLVNGTQVIPERPVLRPGRDRRRQRVGLRALRAMGFNRVSFDGDLESAEQLDRRPPRGHPSGHPRRHQSDSRGLHRALLLENGNPEDGPTSSVGTASAWSNRIITPRTWRWPRASRECRTSGALAATSV